jgi:hypothetical protein
MNEFIAGTDPNQPSEFLAIQSLQQTDSSRVLIWQSIPGTIYHIEYSQSLETESWDSIASNIEGRGATTSWLDSDATRLADPSGFYRVKVER